MSRRLLIGSCGGLTGVYLTRQFRKYDDLIILGADADNASVGRFFVDKLFSLPRARQEDFVDALVDLLETQKIDYYIPTHSEEMLAVSRNEDYIRKRTHARFIVSPVDTFEALNQKDKAYENLVMAGLHAPAVYKDAKHIVLPAFFKKKTGSGSHGTGIVHSSDEVGAILSSNDVFLCQYLQGKEYTVDCLFDYDGRLLGYNQRRRVKTIGGAVSVTANDYEIDILPVIKRLSKSFRFCGCVNFQYILSDGVPYIIDVNLRFASGGLPLSVTSGMNVPEAYMRLFDGSPIGESDYMSDKAPRTMYRYFNEIYDNRDI